LLVAAIVSSPGTAQELTDAHLRAAQDAIRALGVTNQFDQALPDLVLQVQGVLMQRRPDLSRQITTVVNQVALDLVARRRDLNNDAARIWALTFTQEELVLITTFYNSETGRKLSQMYPQVMTETGQAFENWYQRLAEEMLDRTLLEFQQQGVAF
jgi:hypothetical protein